MRSKVRRILVIMRCTGFAPCTFELPFPNSRTSNFQLPTKLVLFICAVNFIDQTQSSFSNQTPAESHENYVQPCVLRADTFHWRSFFRTGGIWTGIFGSAFGFWGCGNRVWGWNRVGSRCGSGFRLGTWVRGSGFSDQGLKLFGLMVHVL